MRVNVYAEEMTHRVEIVEKEIGGQKFTGVRFYLYLPVSQMLGDYGEITQIRGPFIHRPGDDDSSAVTFWGKRDLRAVLQKALVLLDDYYKKRGYPPSLNEDEQETEVPVSLLSREIIFNQIVAERDRQDNKWGGSDHDDQHTVGNWKEFILSHTHRAYSSNFRHQMLRVAALAVAAIEALERKSD